MKLRGIQLKKDSFLTNLFFILFAGMGNLKQGKWQSILIYFFGIFLLGFTLLYAEQNLIRPYYQISQTMRTFVILIFIAFAFFWDGTKLLGRDKKNHFIDHDER